MESKDDLVIRVLSRKEALLLLGGSVGSVLLGGCSGGSASLPTAAASASSSSSTPSSSSSSSSSTGVNSSSSSSSSTSSSSSSLSSVSSVTAEGEIGPYFTDDSASGYNRSKILSNLDGSSTQTGIPLTLTLTVVDSENGNAAYSGAQVDIWHCNAYGVYSNESVESTLGQSWLRGYQITDASGKVTFTTIVPGWYQGRTTHIHLRVRSKYSTASSTSDGTNTTQVFFPQTLIDSIDTTVAPYSSEGTNNTTNANDHVYTPETLGQNLLTLSGSNAGGYASAFTIYLPITTE